MLVTGHLGNTDRGHFTIIPISRHTFDAYPVTFFPLHKCALKKNKQNQNHTEHTVVQSFFICYKHFPLVLNIIYNIMAAVI